MPGENKNPAGEAEETGAAGAATLKRIPDKKKVEFLIVKTYDLKFELWDHFFIPIILAAIIDLATI